MVKNITFLGEQTIENSLGSLPVEKVL